MKYFLGILTAGMLFAACDSSEKSADEALPLTNEKQEISYLVGADHAGQLAQDPNFSKYNMEEVVKGFEIGVKNPESFNQACQDDIQKLLGPDQTQFNMDYKDKASLSIGKLLGSVFKTGWEQAGSLNEFDMKYVSYGFKSGLMKTDTLINPEVKKKKMQDFMAKVNNKVMLKVTKQENVFFDKVKKIPGIATLPQGMFMETLKAGNGGSPIISDDVKAHYVLMNAKGDTLQSSLNSGQPVPIFNLSQVIPGWSVGIPFMKKGGKYKLYVPQSMAYGANPPSPDIEPFATLVFYVELVDFGKAGTLK